ncbi:hypothetical protein R3I93_005901 [Phoxinus phoxinus]|uniref:Uncharacterized protein n=2 Tax=Phoxinus phoxinus TaxID=58324 RepID=A0AAN9DAI9_9TELE
MSTTGASLTSIVTPMTESGAAATENIATTQTTAVVKSKLLFNSSSPVPSEALVISAINTLLISRQSQLNESVKVVNVTYQKISETSYAVVITFNLNNISMSEVPELRNNTYTQVQDVVNNALNTLLNEPNSPKLKPNSSNFLSSSNQIDGTIEYTFQDGDVIQPVSFLNELRSQTKLSAVVTSKLLFNSSSPVPSEALVLSAINTLLNSRQSQLNESVKVVNFTYQKVSETSYAVVFTFSLINISMQADSDGRSNTDQRLQDIINNALNTLLNEPGKQVFVPKSSNFTSTSNQIDGKMEYTFQDGDVIQPVSFLNELRSQTKLSAVVTSKLLFNSSSPVPSEALVISAINTLLISRQSQLNESVKVVNVTYQKISETSYAVVITFNLNNISMSEVPELRNNTYTQVQDVVNNALNTLLNEPNSPKLKPNSSNFLSSSNQIDGTIEYTFQDGDVIQPVSFLNELRSQTKLSAVVTSKLLFNSSSPVPSEALVLSAINTLLISRQSQLNESVKVVNFTYQKVSETSYAVVFTFSLINISMRADSDGRSNTDQRLQDIINNALNTLLNEPGKQVFVPKSSNFTSTSNQIDGKMEYTFQDGDDIQPVSFLNELRSQTKLSAVVTSKLLFNSSSPVPSEALVLSAINTLLNSRQSQLNESVKVVNVTYQKISETSYAVVITFNLNNISMSEVPELRNNTYTQVQDVVNNALNTLLNEPNSPKLKPNSSNFLSSSNQIDGTIEYTFQDGDVIQPVSFLNELRSQTKLSAVVTSKLLFNSSSPVPSEALVLSAINTLLNSRQSQLNESVKVVNFTYQKVSETSYAVVFTFSLINISMRADSDGRSNTDQRLQDIINNALNTLLNEPGKQVFVPKSSNFTSTSNQIDGKMEYTFQDGDDIQPVSFLNELRSQTKLSAVVTSKLLFNSSSPVPSEALVLSAINTLLNSRQSQLNESVKVVNVTYQKISETSYAVVITFNLNNISMSEVPELRNNTYTQVQDVVNNALNTLLNEPNSPKLKPNSSNFLSSSNQIDGTIEYTFQDGDVIQPVSFLNELRSQTKLSAVVTSKLLFNSSSPVPSEALVLSAINTLLNSRQSQLNESVKVVNFTYQKVSETSYAVVFTFSLINISMRADSDGRSNTDQRLQDIINNALNTLLNEPGKQVFVPKSSNFTSTSNQIDGKMEYTFQDGDEIKPVSFLNELNSQLVLTTATTLTTSTTIPPTLIGKVYINILLVFKTLGPIPSEANVLQLVNSLIKPRLRTKGGSTQTSDVSFNNVTFIRINDTSYALQFGFEISNVPMSEKFQLRNETYISIQTSINQLLNDILNDPSAQIDIKQIDFNDTNTVIKANVEYVFSESNINTNSTVVNELFKINGDLTTSTTSPPNVLGRVIIYVSLVFKTRGTLPNQSIVLQVANSLLIGLKLKSNRALTEKSLNDLVSSVNVTYNEINKTSFSLNFGFEISNVPMSAKVDFRNETYSLIESYINTFVSKILNKTTTTPFNFNNVNFNGNSSGNSSVIEANVVYVFSDSDINSFGLVSIFLATPAPTTVYPTVINTTASNNGTNITWIVAIIVPVAIILALIPCWILLCCLLCGCCAAVRRRWHRRQSYNVQHTTRNSLF